jgi:hypothetical protein
MTDDVLAERITVMERTLRRQRLMSTALFALLGAAMAMPASQAQQSTDVLRVRRLVVEDANGRSRVVLGAPLGAEGPNARVGMRIDDERGVERFAVSLIQDGRLVMGFDAPPGTGDDRNRERITLVADQEGGAYMSFKDRRTYVAARTYLDAANQVWMEFSDFSQQPPLRRRIGLKGEESIRP